MTAGEFRAAYESATAFNALEVEAAERRVRDRICSRWIDQAPRFGAVAFALRRPGAGFVASFWAPEVLLFGYLYRLHYTRPRIDQRCENLIALAWPAGPLAWDAVTQSSVDTGKPLFWSPELPEVRVNTEGMARGVYALRSALARKLEPNWPWEMITAFLLLLCLALPAGAQTPPPAIRGFARVVDGDTLEMAGEKVRLHGVDAPELGQTCQWAGGAPWHCGWTAAVRLEEMIGGRPVRCLGAERDRYHRLVARCYVVGEHGPALDLGGALVVRGLALSYRKYSSDYNSAEATAKAARAGMWAGSFASPEERRRGGGR